MNGTKVVRRFWSWSANWFLKSRFLVWHAVRLFAPGLFVIWFLPLQGAWDVLGADFRFSRVFPHCPWLLAELYPGSAHFAGAWSLAASVWFAFVVVHTLWSKLAYQLDRTGTAPRTASRLTMFATFASAVVAALVLAVCLVATSAELHLWIGLGSAVFTAAVNSTVVAWSSRIGHSSTRYMRELFVIDITALWVFGALLTYCHRVPTRPLESENFAFGATAATLLMLTILQASLEILDSVERPPGG